MLKFVIVIDNKNITAMYRVAFTYPVIMTSPLTNNIIETPQNSLISNQQFPWYVYGFEALRARYLFKKRCKI